MDPLLTAGLGCATAGIVLEPGTQIGTYATYGLFALALAFLFAGVRTATDEGS